MENDEKLFIKLRYCFAAGYTLPQYCIDNGIKKPLFVFEKSSEWFLREIYIQFRIDNRISSAQYCFIDDDKKEVEIKPNQRLFGNRGLSFKHISEKSISRFDAIIFLTEKTYKLKANRIILFKNLEKFFIQRAYVDIPILHFLQRFPKVKFFLTNFPSNVGRYKGGKEFGEQLLNAGDLRKILTENKGEHIKTSFNKLGYTNEEVIELLKVSKSKKNLDGTISLFDVDNSLEQIHNGKRITVYQPERYLNKIYFFGPCHYLGRFAPFNKTIESYLQKMLNEANLPYRVENEGKLSFPSERRTCFIILTL